MKDQLGRDGGMRSPNNLAVNGDPANGTVATWNALEDQPTTQTRTELNAGSSRRPSRRWLIWLVVLVGPFIAVGLYLTWRHATVPRLTERSHALRDQKNWPELATTAERWTRLDAGNAEAWLFRAEAAEGLRDWDGLVRALDGFPRNDARAVPALVQKALVEFERLNRPWDGVRTCDEVLRREPRVLVAHKQTIFFFAVTMQRAEMVRRIRRAIQVSRESPESYVYLVSASWLYSGSMYRHNTHWLENDPENETFRVAQALQVYASEVKDDPARAAEFAHIPSAEQLLERYPHNLELAAYLLKQRIADGDLPRVRELLAAVPPEVADGDARIWRARAWCQDTLGDFAAAEQSLRRAFALDPYWWQVHYQLHDLLRRLGRREESEQFFQIYQLSKELSLEITRMERSADGFNDPSFLRSLLKLAELVGDTPVANALRARIQG